MSGNSEALAAHDKSGEKYRNARDLREHKALSESEWIKAQAEWTKACRVFESAYRNDLAPK